MSTLVNLTYCQQFQMINLMSPDPDFNMKNGTTIAALIYGIPSLLLYVRIIVFLLSKRGREEFSSSFYLLFAISGIGEIMFWLLYMYVIRMAMTSIFNFLYTFLPEDAILTRSGFYPTFTYFLVSYVGFFYQSMIITLTSNRLTAIAFPISHQKIWRKLMPYVLIIVFLWPIPFTWQLWFNDAVLCTISDRKGNNYFGFTSGTKDIYGIPISLSLSIMACSFSIIGLIMNSYMVISLCIRRRRTKSEQAHMKTDNVEYKLFLVSAIMFVNETALGIIQTLFTFLGFGWTSISFNTLFDIQQYVVDLIMLSSPWLILFTSSSLRAKILGRVSKWLNFLPKSKNVIQVQPTRTSAVTNTINNHK